MRKFKLFGWPPTPATQDTNAVVVCIDRRRHHGEEIGEEDVRTLAAQLSTLAERQRLGDYEGCDSFSSESRLYFLSTQPDRLTAAATELVATLTWGSKVRIRVSRQSRDEAPRATRPGRRLS